MRTHTHTHTADSVAVIFATCKKETIESHKTKLQRRRCRGNVVLFF